MSDVWLCLPLGFTGSRFHWKYAFFSFPKKREHKRRLGRPFGPSTSEVRESLARVSVTLNFRTEHELRVVCLTPWPSRKNWSIGAADVSVFSGFCFWEWTAVSGEPNGRAPRGFDPKLRPAGLPHLPGRARGVCLGETQGGAMGQKPGGRGRVFRFIGVE